MPLEVVEEPDFVAGLQQERLVQRRLSRKATVIQRSWRAYLRRKHEAALRKVAVLKEDTPTFFAA